MRIQLDKCEFFKKEVEFLGFLVADTGIKKNPEKVRAIVEFTKPKTLKDLRSFLGLTALLRGPRPYFKKFNKLKQTLASEQVMLAYPDYSKEFQLTTDASDYAIGAVLAQADKPNVVADALSRSPLQTHGELNAMTETVLSRKTNSYGGRTNKCF